MLGATARDGALPVALDRAIPLPDGAQLVPLPDRAAMGLDRRAEPRSLGPTRWALSAILPAGYVRTHIPSIEAERDAAPLDPLARHDFMATVMAAMAEEGLSVLLSSHVLAELERVADYLVLIARGVVRLGGTVDDVVAQHMLVTGPAGRPSDPRWQVLESSVAGSQQHLLVRLHAPTDLVPDGWEARTVGVEELALAYLRESSIPTNLIAVEATR